MKWRNGMNRTSSRLLCHHRHAADPSRWFTSSSRILWSNHQGFYSTRRKKVSFESFHSKRSLSSSSRGHQPPRLSRRGKVDLFVIVAGAVGSWLYLRDSDWDRDAWNEKERLLNSLEQRKVMEDDDDIIRSPASSSEERLPIPLRRYLETAMANGPGDVCNNNSTKKTANKMVQAVSVDQTGAFFASQQWYPFHSNLLLTSRNQDDDDFSAPGFVWEAAVSIMGMPNRVLETFIEGKGSIITKAWGKVPLIQVEEEEPYILFWLAMAPLIPSSFAVPSSSNSEKKREFHNNDDSSFPLPLITWNSVQDLCTCSGTLIDRTTNERFEMTFQFDPNTHLLQSIKVTSPCLPYPWQVQYRNYQALEEGGNVSPTRSGVLVPSHIEVGKWKEADGQLELHLRITNERLQPIA